MSDISTELRKTQSVSIFEDVNAFEYANRVAIPLSKSTMVPQAYQGNVSNCIVALEMSHRLGESVLAVMQNTSVIYGKPSLDSKFLIALINAKAGFKDRLDFCIEGEGDQMSCYAFTKRKDGSIVKGPSASIKMAKLEGWYDKKGSKWPSMPELMLQYRSATFFSRIHCPEISMGMQTQDEIIDIGYIETETINKSVAETLNAKFSQQPSENTEYYEAEEIDQNEVNEIDTSFENASAPESTIIEERIEDDDF